MKILNRYIARSFLGSYTILIILGIGLYILFDLMANMDEFTKNPDDSPTRVLWLMWDFYSHNVPLYYSQLGGPVEIARSSAAAPSPGSAARIASTSSLSRRA